MKLKLIRFAYTPENTQGALHAGAWSCYTMEQPWRRWDYPGGEPERSCIPDGSYDLVPYKRRNGDKAFCMVNEDMGVYFADKDRLTDGRGNRFGRFKCLIHGRANYVGDVKGCVATGEARSIHPQRIERMVTKSTQTMAALVEFIGLEPGHTIEISAIHGAIDAPLMSR